MLTCGTRDDILEVYLVGIFSLNNAGLLSSSWDFPLALPDFLTLTGRNFLTGTQLTDRFQLTTRSCSPRSFSTFSFYYRVCVSACRPLPLRRPATSPSAFLLLTNCVRKLKTTSLARLKILSRPSQGCFNGCQLLLDDLL